MSILEANRKGTTKMNEAETLDVMIDGKTYYVVGFLYSYDKKHVALIRKNRPEWQKGRLNGVGGKLKDNERPSEAMEREFREETGYTVFSDNWKLFCTLSWKTAVVECFSALGDLIQLKSITDEQIEICDVDEISTLDTISNIPWLVHMGLDDEVVYSHTICKIYE